MLLAAIVAFDCNYHRFWLQLSSVLTIVIVGFDCRLDRIGFDCESSTIVTDHFQSWSKVWICICKCIHSKAIAFYFIAKCVRRSLLILFLIFEIYVLLGVVTMDLKSLTSAHELPMHIIAQIFYHACINVDLKIVKFVRCLSKYWKLYILSLTVWKAFLFSQFYEHS